MANQDADMTSPYKDSDYYIEDWTLRDRFHQRKMAGEWIGDTYPAQAAGPHPHRTETSPWGPPTFATRSEPPATSRRWESPEYQEDMLRQAAQHSRGDHGHYPDRQRSAIPHWETSTSRNEWEYRHDDQRRISEDNRSRAREEAVARGRGNAPNAQAPSAQVGQRYGGTDAAHIIDSPDLRTAPRGSNAHPQSPWAVQRSSADHVKSDDELTEETSYAEREESRIASVQTRSNNAVVRLRDSRLGLYIYLQIATLLQALNLIGWLHVGQQEAYNFFSLIMQNCSALPGEFRSEAGDREELVDHDYRTPAPPTQCSSSPQIGHDAPPHIAAMRIDIEGTSRQYGPQAPPPHRWGFGTTTIVVASPTATILPAITATAPTGPTTAPAAATDRCVVLRDALSDPNDTCPIETLGEFAKWTRLPNSRAMLLATLHYYAFVPSEKWATGIRNLQGQLPSTSDTPNCDDILAYHTMLALSPSNRRDVPYQFRGFFNPAILMFSIPGLFAAIVNTGRYPARLLAYTHYPFLMENANMAHRGIMLDSTDVLKLESFACSRRNAKSNIKDLDNSVWTTAPRTVAEAFTMSPVPRWADLVHVPAAIATTMSRTLGDDGLRSSQHAPMNGVVDEVVYHAPKETGEIRTEDESETDTGNHEPISAAIGSVTG
ncbi:hypothetical protein C8J57DRAFT_1219534 [Mycena rebaudengoi]|nr:hypothetical protein C8J57DRAFT_1219534 [Mycena rebaudengoi]